MQLVASWQRLCCLLLVPVETISTAPSVRSPFIGPVLLGCNCFLVQFWRRASSPRGQSAPWMEHCYHAHWRLGPSARINRGLRAMLLRLACEASGLASASLRPRGGWRFINRHARCVILSPTYLPTYLPTTVAISAQAILAQVNLLAIADGVNELKWLSP